MDAFKGMVISAKTSQPEMTEELDKMNLEALLAYKKKINRKITNEKFRRMFKASVTIPSKYGDSFNEAARWAHEHGYTKTKSRWAFCKFAITNTIDFIMGEILKESVKKIPPNHKILTRMPQDERSHTSDTQMTINQPD